MELVFNIIAIIFIAQFIFGIFGKIINLVFGDHEVLAIKFFEIKRYSIEREPLIEIHGRETGLISLIWSILGMDTKYQMKVFDDFTEIEKTNLSGDLIKYIPNGSIIEISHSFYRPVFKLFMTYFFASLLFVHFGLLIKSISFNEFVEGLIPLLGIEVPIFITFIISVLGFLYFLISYIFGKVIRLNISSGDGKDGKYGFSFKRGIIEGKKFDEIKLEMAISCYKEIILKARKEEIRTEYYDKNKIEKKDSAPPK